MLVIIPKHCRRKTGTDVETIQHSEKEFQSNKRVVNRFMSLKILALSV